MFAFPSVRPSVRTYVRPSQNVKVYVKVFARPLYVENAYKFASHIWYAPSIGPWLSHPVSVRPCMSVSLSVTECYSLC